MAGDALRVVYSGGGPPPVVDTRLYIGPTSQFGFNREDAMHPIHVGDAMTSTPGNGAHLTAGGVWTSASSRTLKHAFTAVDERGVLERLMSVPITRWQYLGSDEGEHLGPVAEDFAEAFALGNNERYISSVDADGVALASIQGLYQMIEEKDAELDRLRADNQRQQAMMAALLQRVEALEEGR